jgi:hypothetical protein
VRIFGGYATGIRKIQQPVQWKDHAMLPGQLLNTLTALRIYLEDGNAVGI